MTRGIWLAAVALLAVAGCSGINTQPDEVGLHYKGGPISSTKFEKCVNPSQRDWDGPSDPHFTYPFGQRTFEFGGEKSETGAISVATSDNVTMTVNGVVTFALNTECKTLRTFHERLGVKFKAANNGGGTSQGWVDMLKIYMKQPLEKALDAASKEYGYKALYSDPKVKEKWEDKVSALLSQFIQDQAGGDYFCSPSYAGAGECGVPVLTVQTPVPPANILAALTAEQQAVAENNAQKQKNETARTRYDKFTDCKKRLSEANCVLLEAIDSGKVGIIPVPEGTGLNVNPQR